ncbi:MAG: hypothetical protein RI563_11740 [Thiohalophilus sp.]|uniref:hypothetical protein n=1 Tax=Thiohalophilus sp. TaxID=3028392 RepID=UPI00286FBFC8|nr:hypothetical protein [Thiohalophilus sp.]MDR9437546.1 hypothetical protein [Thiohalophilus sp.]
MDTENEQVIDRDDPDMENEARQELIKRWCGEITSAKEHHKPRFDKMREHMKFAFGDQWEGQKGKYVANITQRHIRNRVSSLYAKNPKASAKRKERLDFEIWDESPQSLMQAQQTMAMAQQNPQMMDDPAVGQMMAEAKALLQDAQQGMERRAMLKKVAKSLEILFHHYLDEQVPRFKISAKALVGRTCITSVGYVKLGFQRQMDKSPDAMQRLDDFSQELAMMEAVSADLADGEIEEDNPRAEELRQMIKTLQSQDDVLVREGLVFDFPRSTSIIIDPDCYSLKGFVGARWVAHEFLFTKEKIEEIYEVDVGDAARKYTDEGKRATGKKKKDSLHCVWEVYDKATGHMFTICDGYKEYLSEPEPPTVYVEQFFPIFSLTFNDLEHDEEIFPPSDVELIKDAQKEHNRSREGLREHRKANRPRYFAATGALSENDQDKMSMAVAHEVINIDGMAPNERIEDKLQAWRGAPIDPGMYDTSYNFDDIMRTVGTQEANLGGTAGGTATESSIAEGSRLSSVASNVDDLDDLLTDVARAAGQIMLEELNEETVKQIAGPGAVWPDMTRAEIAKEVYLEVVAGSSGRPNKAQEIANMERILPYLVQIPGIDPTWLAKQVLDRMDDRLDMTEALAEGMPSITAMNANAQPGRGEDDPNQQGQEGGNNARAAGRGNEGAQPAMPGDQARG